HPGADRYLSDSEQPTAFRRAGHQVQIWLRGLGYGLAIRLDRWERYPRLQEHPGLRILAENGAVPHDPAETRRAGPAAGRAPLGLPERAGGLAPGCGSRRPC